MRGKEDGGGETKTGRFGDGSVSVCVSRSRSSCRSVVLRRMFSPVFL